MNSPALRRFLLVDTRARTQSVEQQLLPLLYSPPSCYLALILSGYFFVKLLLLLGLPPSTFASISLQGFPTEEIVLKSPIYLSLSAFYEAQSPGFFLSVSIQINNEAPLPAPPDLRLQYGQKCNNNIQTIKRNAVTRRNDITLYSSLLLTPLHRTVGQ